MVLGIILWCIAGISFFLSWIWPIISERKNDWWFGSCMFVALLSGIGGSFCWYSPTEYPDYHSSPYSINIDGQRIGFADYQYDGSDLVIPAHYYFKKGFINSWELCDTPIRIEVPEGQDVIITDHRPAPQPRIVGGCE